MKKKVGKKPKLRSQIRVRGRQRPPITLDALARKLSYGNPTISSKVQSRVAELRCEIDQGLIDIADAKETLISEFPLASRRTKVHKRLNKSSPRKR